MEPPTNSSSRHTSPAFPHGDSERPRKMRGAVTPQLDNVILASSPFLLVGLLIAGLLVVGSPSLIALAVFVGCIAIVMLVSVIRRPWIRLHDQRIETRNSVLGPTLTFDVRDIHEFTCQKGASARFSRGGVLLIRIRVDDGWVQLNATDRLSVARTVFRWLEAAGIDHDPFPRLFAPFWQRWFP